MYVTPETKSFYLSQVLPFPIEGQENLSTTVLTTESSDKKYAQGAKAKLQSSEIRKACVRGVNDRCFVSLQHCSWYIGQTLSSFLSPDTRRRFCFPRANMDPIQHKVTVRCGHLHTKKQLESFRLFPQCTSITDTHTGAQRRRTIQCQ